LLRGYEGLWAGAVAIREQQLAGLLGWTEERVVRHLQRLHAQGLVDYHRPLTPAQVILLRERAPDRLFTIDEQAYAARRDRALRRTEAMLDYIGGEVACREVFLRQYFGESLTAPCGHCDRCKQRRIPQADWLAELQRVLDASETVTVKAFLARFDPAHVHDIRAAMTRLAEEGQIRIVDDTIHRPGA
jgi:hypothetical protein